MDFFVLVSLYLRNAEIHRAVACCIDVSINVRCISLHGSIKTVATAY